MKIFVMPAIYPCEDNKQMGIYIYEQCEVLKKHGHELTILDCSSRNYRNWRKCNKQRTYRDCNGEVYVNWVRGIAQSRLPRLAVESYIKNIGKIFEKAIKEQGKPDVIYAHFTFPCGYAASIFSKKYNIPYIVQEHYSLFLQKDLPVYLRNITKKTIEDASAFYCVSESLKKNIAKFTRMGDRIGVVHNLINDRYRYFPPVEKNEFEFFSAGNLYKGKCFDVLIEAFCRAFSREDRVRLRIAGDGNEYENLKDKIEQENRSEQIILLGRINSDRMFEEYKRCDCFALLSEKETFGIVYREAMAVGRPVIAARNGGVEENWQEKFGILVEKHNIEQSADAMKRMYKNYSNYNNEYISQKALEIYSSENIYKALENILENVNR